LRANSYSQYSPLLHNRKPPIVPQLNPVISQARTLLEIEDHLRGVCRFYELANIGYQAVRIPWVDDESPIFLQTGDDQWHTVTSSAALIPDNARRVKVTVGGTTQIFLLR